MNSTSPTDLSLVETADETHYIKFDLYPKDNYDFHRASLYGYNQGNNDAPI